MPKYTFTAIKKDGKTKSGEMEAATQQAVTDLLSKQGLKPIIVKPVKTGFDPNNLNISFLRPNKVKNKDLVVFTRQLATMVNAGVALVRALAALQAQSESKPLKKVLEDVVHEVEGGKPFADALAKHPKVFNEVYVNMVAAGETGGILDEILKKLANQQEKEASIKKKVKSASTYPVILLVITIIAFFGTMLFIIPKIGGILKDLGGEDAELPVYTKALLSASDFMVSYWYIFIIILVAGTFMLFRYIRTEKGKRAWHRFLLRIPVVKTIVIKVAVARFSRIFASLMSSGVGVLEALKVTGNAIGNTIIKEELEEAAKQVKNGKQLSEPLSTSKHFPPIVAQMLATGEETGKVDTVLVKVADFYEEEVDAAIDAMSSIIEPVMIVLMGGMVGLIAASVLGPIASLSQNIGE